MKLLSPEMELKAIKTICSGKSVPAGTMLSSVDSSYFHYDPAQQAYNRILSVVRSKGIIPSYVELCSDPTIPEDDREILLHNKQKPAITSSKVRGIVNTLSSYRKARLLFENAEKTIKTLQGDNLDIDDLLEKNANHITKARANNSLKRELLHFGRGNNSTSLVKQLLSNQKSPVIPTGFKAFDSKNGGWFPGSLIVIGATTGGGKSTLANQLLINHTSRGYDTVIVPLEMTTEECTARILANISEVDVSKFLLRRITTNEKQKVKKFYSEWVNKLKDIGARYSIHEPEEDVSIEDLLFTLKPYGYKVILIDYISLLKGVDGDDQWRQLSQVARFAKIFAKTHNIVVILLVQVSEGGLIRYSRGIAEHANNCFPAGTLILTNKGPQRIETLVNDPYKPIQDVDISIVSEGCIRKATKFFYNGVKPVYELTTARGYSVETTKDQQFRVLNKDFSITWKPLSNIKVGDWVVRESYSNQQNSDFVSMPTFSQKFREKNNSASGVSAHRQIALPKNLTVSLAKLIGYLLADGWVTVNGIGIQCADKKIIDDFIKCFAEIFDIKLFRASCVSSSGTKMWVVNCYLENVRNYLMHLGGLSGGATNKFIPNGIFKGGSQMVANCLAAMFDCDGSTSKSGDRKLYCTVSKNMCMSYVEALRLFGIEPTIRIVPLSEFNPNHSDQYHIEVAGKKNLDLFNANIKCLLLRKSKKAKSIAFEKTRMLPMFSNALQKHKGKNNLYTRGCKKSIVGKEYEARFDLVTQPNYLKDLKFYDLDLYNKLIYVIDSNFTFDQVRSVNYIGKKRVFDLGVPSNHTFIANGFVSHNCWIWTFTDTNRQSGIVDIKQIKARNQTAFDFQLAVEFAHMRFRDVKKSEVEALKSKKGDKKRQELSNIADTIEEYLGDVGNTDEDE